MPDSSQTNAFSCFINVSPRSPCASSFGYGIWSTENIHTKYVCQNVGVGLEPIKKKQRKTGIVYNAATKIFFFLSSTFVIKRSGSWVTWGLYQACNFLFFPWHPFRRRVTTYNQACACAGGALQLGFHSFATSSFAGSATFILSANVFAGCVLFFNIYIPFCDTESGRRSDNNAGLR